MAACDLCNARIDKSNRYLIQTTSIETYVCPDCKKLLDEIKNGDVKALIAAKEYPGYKLHYMRNYVDSSFSVISEELDEAAEEKAIEEKAIEEKAIEEYRQEYESQINSIILTTCHTVEGYTISEQLGLVFGEVIFKSGAMKSLGASFANLSDMISFGDKELSGSSRLINDSREYAILKMKQDAVKKGANAIVGIDYESMIGGDVMHVTIMGTAVKIEKR